MPGDLSFLVLGPLRVERGRVEVPLPRSAVVRGLLGTLVRAGGEPVPTERLIGLLWRDRSDRIGPGSVHVGMSRLRGWLGGAGCGGSVGHSGGGYRFTGGGTDLDGLADAVAGLAGLPDPERYARLRAAAALCRGTVLADVPSLDREDPLVTAVTDRVRRVCLDLADVSIAVGHPQTGLAPLERLARLAPYDETVHACLIRLLAAANRPADALRRYQRLRTRLAEDLGVDPAPEVQKAQLAVLRQDRSIAVGRRPVSQIPPDAADLVGIQEKQATAVDRLTDGLGARTAVPVVVMSGPAGAGKTALAVRVAHAMRDHYPDGRIFLELRGSSADPMSTDEAIRRLTVIITGRPSTGDAPVEAYRSAIDGGRVLLILDDAVDAAQVRPLLPGSPTVAVVVTCRRRLPDLAGSSGLDLGTLPAAAALELLTRIVGRHRIVTEPEASRELVDLCGSLPLALRIAGARLASRPHRPVSWLTGRLADEHRRLDELAYCDLSVRGVLSVSYRALDPSARRALRLLGVLDVAAVPVWLLPSLLGLRRDVAEDAMDQLAEARLVDLNEDRWTLHDLIRLYAREQAEACEDIGSRRSAIGRAVAAALEHVPADPVRWLTAEEPVFVALVERAAAVGLDELACRLARAVAVPFAAHNSFDRWSRTHQAALQAARAVGDRAAEGNIECGLAELQLEQDRFREAESAYRAVLTVARASDDRRGQAAALIGLARARWELAGHREAATLLREATRITTLLGDRGGLAIIERTLGGIYRELGYDRAALDLLHQAAARYRSVGDDRGLGITLRGIGLVHRARDDLTQATRWCLDAHHLLATSPLLQAYSVQGLAKIAIRRGERTGPELADAEDTCRDLADRYGTALIRRTRGEAALAAGHTDHAIADLTAAHQQWTRLQHPLGTARTNRDLALAYAAAGDHDQARAAAQRAQATFRTAGVRETGEMSPTEPRHGRRELAILTERS